jgi:hypothetical protein
MDAPSRPGGDRCGVDAEVPTCETGVVNRMRWVFQEIADMLRSRRARH